MFKYKPAKIFFFIGVLLFVAKPFLGFSMINTEHPLTVYSILLKSFTKRKPEYSENSSNSMESIQKKLADPALPFLLLFSSLLCGFLPILFGAWINITNRFLRGLSFSLPVQGQIYLLNRTLLI